MLRQGEGIRKIFKPIRRHHILKAEVSRLGFGTYPLEWLGCGWRSPHERQPAPFLEEVSDVGVVQYDPVGGKKSKSSSYWRLTDGYDWGWKVTVNP